MTADMINARMSSLCFLEENIENNFQNKLALKLKTGSIISGKCWLNMIVVSRIVPRHNFELLNWYGHPKTGLKFFRTRP